MLGLVALIHIEFAEAVLVPSPVVERVSLRQFSSRCPTMIDESRDSRIQRTLLAALSVGRQDRLGALESRRIIFLIEGEARAALVHLVCDVVFLRHYPPDLLLAGQVLLGVGANSLQKVPLRQRWVVLVNVFKGVLITSCENIVALERVLS